MTKSFVDQRRIRRPHPATARQVPGMASLERSPHAATVQTAMRAPHAATMPRAERAPHAATVQGGRAVGVLLHGRGASQAVQRMQAPTRRVLVYDNTMPKGDPLYRCRFLITTSGSEDVYGVDSIASMIQKLGGGAPISHLILCGHGMEGMLGLGSGTSSSYSIGKDIQHNKLDDIATALTTLAGYLTPNACIFLMGCHVGAETKGRNLLRRLSKLYFPGRRVLASDKYLEPDKDDEDFIILSAGGQNTKRGERVTLFDLTIAIDGNIEPPSNELPTPDDIERLICWKVDKKAKTH